MTGQLNWFTCIDNQSTAIDKAIVIANEAIQPVESVRDLGVYLDSELNTQAHITKTTQACLFQL